ncbi:hypothetical protein HGRIS_005048 [Hohenbuehelia grisea]|uniref:GH16 domain-containing protein n=1 Tax=Hohenbuehelia grisea TaxID=104357 RepID=A0ABR3JE10_9AGAR
MHQRTKWGWHGQRFYFGKRVRLLLADSTPTKSACLRNQSSNPPSTSWTSYLGRSFQVPLYLPSILPQYSDKMLFAASFLLALPLVALAGSLNHNLHAARRSKSRHSLLSRSRYRNQTLQNRGPPGIQSKYNLVDLYQGKDFLNETQWDYFTAPDPTHGTVQYQSLPDAVAKKLAFVQDDGTTVLAVDDQTPLPPNKNRDSVRITSKKSYNQGLFIADFFAMPHGCSVWPAWWTVGPNWPTGGEIDVLEGVHNSNTNAYTLHTGQGCEIPAGNGGSPLKRNGHSKRGVAFEATVKTTNCASSGNDNTGCGIHESDTRTYGEGFNRIAGGVYAHLWNSDGISIWHFARDEIPADISAKNPDPKSWGNPSAFFSNEKCDIDKHFHDHSLVIDTTICGDLGNPTYGSSGCPGTCAEAVQDPANFRFAKWKINYIAVYQ